MVFLILLASLQVFTQAQENIELRKNSLKSDNYFSDLEAVSRKGVHKYKINKSPIRSAAQMKLGLLTPPEIESRFDYNRVYRKYGDNAILLVDYERKLFKRVGHMSVKLGGGLMFARGEGIFDPEGINQSIPAMEQYTLLIWPVSLGITYKLQYWSTQFLSPFLSAGVDLFNIIEIRDDGIRPNLMSMPATHFGGGVHFIIDSFTGSKINHLEKEYGVNHMYILAEMRQYLNITADTDLTNTLFLGGIGVDF